MSSATGGGRGHGRLRGLEVWLYLYPLTLQLTPLCTTVSWTEKGLSSDTVCPRPLPRLMHPTRGRAHTRTYTYTFTHAHSQVFLNARKGWLKNYIGTFTADAIWAYTKDSLLKGAGRTLESEEGLREGRVLDAEATVFSFTDRCTICSVVLLWHRGPFGRVPAFQALPWCLFCAFVLRTAPPCCITSP